MREDLTPIARMLQRFLTEMEQGPPRTSFQAIGDRVGITGAHINNLARVRVSNPGPPMQTAILLKLSAEIGHYLLRHPEDRSDVENARRALGLDPPLPQIVVPLPKPPPRPQVPGRKRRARGQREAGRRRRRLAASD